MPTTGGLITTIYGNFLDIGGSSSDDAVLRARILFHLKKARMKVWALAAARGFSWTRDDQETTIPGGAGSSSSAELEDFFGRSAHTNVYVKDQNFELKYRAPGHVRRMLELVSSTGGRPLRWTIDGTTTNRLPKIVVAPRPSVDTVLSIRDYIFRPSDLVDEVVSGVPTDGETLKEIPEDYHEAVLAEYVVKRLMRDAGDGGEGSQEQEFRQSFAEIAANEMPVSPRRFPRYGRRAYV